ncbi:MAG: ELM1/GtrOC1 family putative glycosyltransferase [Flavobacteriales bacterium]
MTLRKKTILVLTDGRAGHRSKTQGVLNALAQLSPIEVIWLEVRAPHPILRSLSRWLTRRTDFSSLGWYLKPHQLPSHIDVVVSSGADTLVPNLLLSRHYACPNIINSSLKGFAANQFAVALQLGQALSDLNLNVPPNQMSFDHDGQRMLAARQRLAVSSDRCVLTVLIGENTREYQSINPQLLAQIVAWFRQHADAVLLLSSSRRTQLATEDALIQVLPLQADDQVTWVKQGQSCHITDYIYAADWVLCTADSESMLAEVVSAGRLALLPEYAGQGLTAQNQWLTQLTTQGHVFWLNQSLLSMLRLEDLPCGNRQDMQQELVQLLAARLPKLTT